MIWLYALCLGYLPHKSYSDFKILCHSLFLKTVLAKVQVLNVPYRDTGVLI